MWRKPYSRRDASNLAQIVVDGADQHGGGRVELAAGDVELRGHAIEELGRARRVRRDPHEPAVHRQRDVVGRLARARRALVHPADLLLDAFGHEVDDGVPAEHAGAQARVHADDRGLATRESQHTRAAAADEERGMGKLDGLRETVELADRVVVAVEAEGRRTEQTLHDSDRFLEPADAHAGLVDVDARRLVVGRHPAGADAEGEPPFRHHVERRRHAVHEHGMAIVDAEDRRSQPQAVGGHRRGSERDHRLGVVAVGEVVRHHHLVEPDRFQPAQTLDPVGDGQVRRRRREREA